MAAVERPRAECGHASALTQQCGRCLRWCCPVCYSPWWALACGTCRQATAESGVDARAGRERAESPPAGDPRRCRERLRPGREGAPADPDVAHLALRVAQLERRLEALGAGRDRPARG